MAVRAEMPLERSRCSTRPTSTISSSSCAHCSQTSERMSGVSKKGSPPAIGRTLHVVAKHISPGDDERYDDHHHDCLEIARERGRGPTRQPLRKPVIDEPD